MINLFLPYFLIIKEILQEALNKCIGVKSLHFFSPPGYHIQSFLPKPKNYPNFPILSYSFIPRTNSIEFT